MPNLNRRGGRDRGNYYKANEHNNDRGGGGFHSSPNDGSAGRRRVSFKNHGSGGRNNKNVRQRGWDNKIRSLLSDEDIEMSANVRGNDRYNNYANQQRRRHGDGGGRGMRKILPESPTHWYKVIIRYGNRFDKNYVMRLLENFIKPTPLIPIGYKISKEDVNFAVEDHRTAVELQNADKRITASDGWKLTILVRPYTPMVEVDSKLVAAMKKVMSSRYNLLMKALDLTKFHSDPQFLAEDMFCPLNRPNIMMAALDIIAESIPDLVALNLTDNKLNVTEHMKIIVDKCANLKILHIGNNRLREIKQLDPLRGLKLEELVLDGNPLCDKYIDKDSYIRDVRERFPKVIKLDGADLPPPILFDIEEDSKLPPSKACFMASKEGAPMVRQFLEQYYQMYDSQSGREPLHMAYHELAQFSMDAYLMSGEPISHMGAYLGESRNLTRLMNNADKKFRFLKRGKLSIIEALQNLPKTRHDPTTFVVDLVLYTPVVIQLNVCGLFSETSRKCPMRYFSRVFMIVKTDSTFSIINDQLTVLMATSEQVRKYNKMKAEEASTAAQAAVVAPPELVGQPGVGLPVMPSPPVVAPPVAAPGCSHDVTRQQMVSMVSMKTNMNVIWSEKCLNETNWNLEQALYAFSELQKNGAIPAEAFVK